MKLTAPLISLLLATVTGASLVLAAQSKSPATYYPEDRWRTSSPEAQGMDSAALADLVEFVRAHRIRIHSLTIVRNGYLVFDATFFPFEPDGLHDLASVTKSITATMIGIAIGDGHIRDVHQPVLSLFEGGSVEHRDDRKERMTVEHVLSMSSGLDCEYQGGERTLREMRASGDWVHFMLDRPMVAEPGTKGEYCSGGMHLLSGIVSQVTHANELDYARTRLFGPLGIRDAVWPADAHGISHGWGDLHLRPHDMAKIGYLWMNGGRWGDRQIIPADWMASAIRSHARVLGHDYGYGLWLNPDRDPFLFEANGRGGQRITVLPSQQLVLAITGGAFEPGDIAPFIWKAVRSDGPLPANQAATRRLNLVLADARRPVAGERSAPGGETAQTISGTRYLLADNPISWRAITLTFPKSGTAMARFEFGDGRIDNRPIGLEGTPLLSPRGRYNLPVAVEGRWTDRSTFELDYDEVANINSFVCRFAFDDAGATVGVKERSGELDIRIKATPAAR